MKTLFAIASIAMSVLCFAQDNMKDGRYHFQEVLEFENADADKLYSASLIAMANLYKSAQDVVQFKDENEKKVIGKGYFIQKQFSAEYKVQHSIKLEAKDNRVRVTIYDITVVGNGYNKTLVKHRPPRQVEEITGRIKQLIEKCKTEIGKSLSSDDDDW